MTDQQVEKLQRGIEAALRELGAMDFGATIEKGKEGARIVVHAKPGYSSQRERQESELIADRLRLDLMDRGYHVEGGLIPPLRDGQNFSFVVREP